MPSNEIEVAQNLLPYELHYRHDPLLVSLAPDAQRAVVVREVVAVDADEFGQAQAAGVEHQDDQRVAFAEGVVALGLAVADDARHAALGNESREAVRRSEGRDPAHHLLLDAARAVQPAEETPQRRQFAVHRCGAHAVRLRAVEDPLADVVGRDAARVERGVVVAAPRQEPFDVAAVVAHRERRVAAFGLQISDEFVQHTMQIYAKRGEGALRSLGDSVRFFLSLSANRNRIDMKQTWKPGTVLYPLPAVLVSCGARPDEYNMLTVAWTGTVCTNPPMCYISVRPERHSYGIIRRTGEFVINLTTRDLARATDWCGVRSGRDCDKFREMGLTPAPAGVVAAPIIVESPVNIECRVRQVLPLGSHDMFLAEVVNVQVDEAYIDPATGRFCLERACPIVYSHGEYFALGEALGHFGWSVRKKRK